ncbi:protoporphyrinogen/coproporphyrinogen oxidase [Pendulispora albinea]|uniref:NAD(P)-binding protein n=1 Tax=Pendulispora albinea TaxID=2741071 RepID=A0ABZ2LZS4_9BACT
MENVRHLIIGAGITGLATAAFLRDPDYLVLEADTQIGGYCKTITKDGFVWDYSGHFFHFKHPDIEAWLRARMAGQNIRVVEKKTFIAYGDRKIDFPFQKNIHQLPQDEFIECLHDVYFAKDASPSASGGPANFKEMLYARFGRGIAEKFLIPYNEKLYACDLATLDKDAMGRFFPHANLTEIVRNMRAPDNASYNATFTYPEGGAIEYVKAIAREVLPHNIALEEALVGIDLRTRVAKTTKREVHYERLVSSAPFHRLVELCGLPHDASAFSWNKVLVFNLGFDRKGARDVHWVYYPNRARSFYRIGYYDNIFDTDRMSLYVELGYARDAPVDIPSALARVLADLEAEGVTSGHRLVAHHAVVMDPAYVHITRESMAEHRRLSRILQAHGIYSAGRYGGWTYCSIEDNIVEAKALAADFEP